jgi:hypothetical protein
LGTYIKIGLAIAIVAGLALFWSQNRRLKRTEELLEATRAEKAAWAGLAESRGKALADERAAANERAARLNKTESERAELEKEMESDACDVDALGGAIYGRLCGGAGSPVDKGGAKDTVGVLGAGP